MIIISLRNNEIYTCHRPHNTKIISDYFIGFNIGEYKILGHLTWSVVIPSIAVKVGGSGAGSIGTGTTISDSEKHNND